MKKFFNLIIILLLSISCRDGSDVSYRELFFYNDADLQVNEAKNYSAFDVTRRQSYFLENFNSNINGWPIKYPSQGVYLYSYIKNGNYIISGGDLQERFATFSILKPINVNNNFEIETVFKMEYLGKVKNVGLLFGSANERDGFVVTIENNPNSLSETYVLRVQYGKADKNVVKDFEMVETGNIWYTSNPVKLTVRKINKTLLFFVNEKYLGRLDYFEFAGNYIGFKMVGAEMYIDSLSIDYLKF